MAPAVGLKPAACNNTTGNLFGVTSATDGRTGRAADMLNSEDKRHTADRNKSNTAQPTGS